MNDDELIDRLRQTLQDEASQVSSPPDAWEQFQRRAEAAPNRARRPPWVLAAPIGVLGLAAAIIAAVVVNTTGSSSKTKIHTAAAPSTEMSAAGSATTVAPGSGPGASPGPAAGAAATPGAGPPEGPVPAGFEAGSVTFVSPAEGFVLGSAPCAKPPCTSIARTTDGGRTWVGIPAPVAPYGSAGLTGVSELRFANANDGWAWGPDLWSTHDGGRTWHQLTVPGGAGRVYALEAAAGTVHMAVFDGQAFRVATAPVGCDTFAVGLSSASVPVGGGPVPTIQLVLAGRTGWMLEVDRTVIGGLTLVNGTWRPWTPPCLDANGPAMLAASSPTELVAACDQGVWGPATPTGEQLWVSHNGGAAFTDAGAVPGGDAQAVASPSPGTIIVADQSGVLEATFDGGRSWSPVLRPAAGQQVADLGFTTTSQGVVVLHAPGQAGLLMMSNDGGRTWHGLRFS
jgi:photosystem II stability/assembly factor-like uncharacterized protein